MVDEIFTFNQYYKENDYPHFVNFDFIWQGCRGRELWTKRLRVVLFWQMSDEPKFRQESTAPMSGLLLYSHKVDSMIPNSYKWAKGSRGFSMV